MAEIDKALPNEVRKEINIPGVEEIQVELEKNVKAKYRKTDTYKNLDFKSKGGLIRKPKLAKRGF